MTRVSGNTYYCDIDSSHNMIIFSDGIGGAQHQTEKYNIANINETVVFKAIADSLSVNDRYNVSYQPYSA